MPCRDKLTLAHNSDGYNRALETRGALTFRSGTVSISEGGPESAVFTQEDITIDAGASVDVTNSDGSGLYSYGSLYIAGVLTATGGSSGYAVNISSVFVTGGTLKTTADSGDVYEDVIVSAGTVDILGDIGGSLTVFDGTVNITGTVVISTNVIGGTVNVDGKEVTRLSNPTLVLDASKTGTNPFLLAAVTGPAANGVSGYSWNGAEKKLTFSGFNYTSDAATALKIVNGAVEIVLAPGSVNTLASSYSGGGTTYGIETENDITFSGSGFLTITSGTSEPGYSVGIGSDYGSTIINGGYITAIGGSAEYSSGVLTNGVIINGGSLTAKGGTGTTMSAGAHMAYGKITFAGGTLVLSGNEYAYYSADQKMELTAPSYTWWANADANTDPGGMGTDGAVTPFTDESDSNYPFVKLSTSSAYPVIVNYGTTDKSTALQGETVTITAQDPETGMQFKEWTVQSSGITLANAKTFITSFTMPQSAVEVTATYEPIPYLYVLSVPVNDANKDNITGQGISGGVSYDPDTRTLTLNNAVITSSTLVMNAIHTRDDLTVKLVGQNRMGTAPGNPANQADYSVNYGIISTKSLSLTGEGSLTVYDAITGIYGVDNLTLDIGGSLTVVEYGNDGLSCCLKTEERSPSIEAI